LIESPFKVIIHEAAEVDNLSNDLLDSNKNRRKLDQFSNNNNPSKFGNNDSSATQPLFEFPAQAKPFTNTPARIEYELNNWNLQLNQTLKIMESSNVNNVNNQTKRALTPITDTSEEESNGLTGSFSIFFFFYKTASV
jgi:hypothetical protein